MIIKICGITNVGDAKLALEAGADWIGLNLVGGPRRIDLATLAAITSKLEDASRAVALVSLTDHQVSPSMLGSLRDSGVTRLQLYGQASGATFEQLDREGFASIGVLPVSGSESLDEFAALLVACGGHRPEHVILDASATGQLGGTGKRLDWEQLAKERSAGRFDDWPPIILAGGLNPTNVTDAIRLTNPAGVDVSSGVEAVPGRKDYTKVEAFVQAARE